MDHVYVTASGYGRRVIPAAAPSEFAIEPNGDLRVTVTASTPFGVRHVSPEGAIDPEGADPVADVTHGPTQSAWWLDAGPYAVPLPRGWTALVTGDVRPAFYLVQDPDRTVFVQTARNRPTIETLVAPGQSVVGRGANDRAEWIELSYVHEGQRWLQRHAVLRTSMPTMVTAQAPAAAFDEARAVQLAIVHHATVRDDGS